MTEESASLNDMESRVDSAISDQNNPNVGAPDPNDVSIGDLAPWMYGEGVIGKGEKPEWLADKFTTVSDQAKAHTELEKRFGGFAGAPKDSYAIDKFEGRLNAEDPRYHKFSEMAKEMNMSQDGFNNIIDMYLTGEEAQTKSRDSVIADMTPEQKESASIASQWCKNNFTEKEQSMIDSWVQDVDSLNILMKFRSLTNEKPIPNKASVSRLPSMQELQNMMKDNYKAYSDPTTGYRERHMALRAKILAAQK